MNKNFSTKKQTYERLVEIASCENLPKKTSYCEEDLLNAKYVKFFKSNMILILENEAMIIDQNGSLLFSITTFDLKKLFGTKRRLYSSYIAEKIDNFLEESLCQ